MSVIPAHVRGNFRRSAIQEVVGVRLAVTLFHLSRVSNLSVPTFSRVRVIRFPDQVFALLRDDLRHVKGLYGESVHFHRVPDSTVIRPDFLLCFVLFRVRGRVVIAHLPLRVFYHEVFFIGDDFNFNARVAKGQFIVVVIAALRRTRE